MYNAPRYLLLYGPIKCNPVQEWTYSLQSTYKSTYRSMTFEYSPMPWFLQVSLPGHETAWKSVISVTWTPTSASEFLHCSPFPSWFVSPFLIKFDSFFPVQFDSQCTIFFSIQFTEFNSNSGTPKVVSRRLDYPGISKSEMIEYSKILKLKLVLARSFPLFFNKRGRRSKG